MAPSPMAKVRLLGKFWRTNLTIWAFYFGETQQQITDLLFKINLVNNYFSFLDSSTTINTSPEITIEISKPTLSILSFIYFLNSSSITSLSKESNHTILLYEESKLVENPISMAVSILSPVKTHTLIPARRKFSIHWRTSSYNLSSIAVAPTIIRSVSSSPSISSLFFLEWSGFLTS